MSALEAGLCGVLDSPRDEGTLEAIFVRPREGRREALVSVEVSPEGGVAGDRWATDHWQKLPDGRPDPLSQVSLMNARILRLVAGGDDAMCLAGDNLIVDMDLSAVHLPAGSRLRIGRDVVLELTAQAHTGCAKFERRYGTDARAFINSPTGRSLNLRGRYARIVQGGTIRVGDAVTTATHVGAGQVDGGA
jgi:hypothetical protein